MMNGNVLMKALEETGMDWQNGWYWQPRTISGNRTANSTKIGTKPSLIAAGWQRSFGHCAPCCANGMTAWNLWRMQWTSFSGRMSTIVPLWFLKHYNKGVWKSPSPALSSTPGRWMWTWSLVLSVAHKWRFWDHFDTQVLHFACESVRELYL